MHLGDSVMVTRFSAMAAVLAALAASAACAPAQRQGTDDVPPELIFDKLDFRVYRGPVLTADGHAERMGFRRDTAGLTAEQVTVRFPPSNDRAEARVHATRGTGNLREHWFQATDGVRAEQSGQVATSEQARYSAADGLVRGDTPIEVRGGAYTLSGPGFTLDPADEVLHVEGGARVVAGGGRR